MGSARTGAVTLFSQLRLAVRRSENQCTTRLRTEPRRRCPAILGEVSPAILLLARALDSGGSERQLTETAKALHRDGWNVHVGCFHDSGIRARELREAGVPVVRFPVRSFASVSGLKGLAAYGRYVARHRIVLTHSFDAPMNLFSVFAGRLFVRPVVLSSQRSYRTLRTPAEQKLLRVTDKLVTATVVNCEAMRRHLISDEGVSPDRVHVCYNGIDTEKFRPARETPRPESLRDARLVIGTVCVLRPEKGLPVLLDAFACACREVSGMKLVFVGSGPMKDELQSSAERLGIAGSVVFQPATDDVPRWLSAMDIFVLPSRSEALSNSLMEAMACGAAAVASNVGGNPELVRDGETGLLFPSGDVNALAAGFGRLAADAELRKRMAAAGSEFIRSRMSIETAAARMAAIYRELLVSGRHTPG
jgi:L-malate glycosyltransferase